MRTFIGFGQAAYIGQPFTQAIKLAGIQTLCVPLLFQWLSYGAATAKPNINVLVDLENAHCKSLDQIRSIYIDNLGSNVPVYVYFPDSNYTIVAQPNSEGWYPAYTNQKKMWVVGEGFLDGSIPQTFILASNVYIPPSVNVEIPQTVQLWRASPVISRGTSIYNSAFGVPALGDQFATALLNAAIAGNTAGLWGTPYSSGFLYLTNLVVTCVGVFSGVVGLNENGGFQLESTGVGGVLLPLQFDSTQNPANGGAQLLTMSGLQIKLDATQTWRGRITTPVSQGALLIVSAFTQQP